MKEERRSNALERMAASYVRRRNGLTEDSPWPPPPESIAALRRVEIGALVWSALAGLVAGGVLGAAEIILFANTTDEAARMPLSVWAWFLVLILVMSGLEVLFLYWNGLRAAASASRIGGLGLLADNDEADLLARALGRAAIELPNPMESIYGIDPFARASKLAVWGLRLVYRLKVGFTSFLVRAGLQRILARSILRLLIPLLAGPIYAVWNSVITFRIVREIRVRAYGPHVIRAFARRVAEERGEVGRPARLLLLSGVAEAIMRSRDAHPSFELFLSALLSTLEVEPSEVDVEWQNRRAELSSLAESEKDLLIDAVVLTCLLDGSVSRRERAMLAEVYEGCGRTLDLDDVFRALRDFSAGRCFSSEVSCRTSPAPATTEEAESQNTISRTLAEPGSERSSDRCSKSARQ